MRTIFGILAIIALLWLVRSNAPERSPSPSAPVAAAAAPDKPGIDKSPEMQTGRLKLMEKLKNEGVFQKVEMPGSQPRLHVAPRFYTLDFDLKQKFVSVVYAYYFDGKTDYTDLVSIYDSKTGKDVGYYALPLGLKLY